MNTIVKQGGYMQEVRTAVGPDIYYDERPGRDEDAAESPSEWVAIMGDDVLSQRNKLARLLCWLHAFDALPVALLSLGAIAKYAKASRKEIEHDMRAVQGRPGIRDAIEDPSVKAMIRTIGEDVLLKRCKIMRLCNWLRVLRVNPPGLQSFQEIGSYCGVSRQAVHKDCDEIIAKHRELYMPSPCASRMNSLTNRSNYKLKD